MTPSVHCKRRRRVMGRESELIWKFSRYFLLRWTQHNTHSYTYFPKAKITRWTQKIQISKRALNMRFCGWIRSVSGRCTHSKLCSRDGQMKNSRNVLPRQHGVAAALSVWKGKCRYHGGCQLRMFMIDYTIFFHIHISVRAEPPIWSVMRGWKHDDVIYDFTNNLLISPRKLSHPPSTFSKKEDISHFKGDSLAPRCSVFFAGGKQFLMEIDCRWYEMLFWDSHIPYTRRSWCWWWWWRFNNFTFVDVKSTSMCSSSWLWTLATSELGKGSASGVKIKFMSTCEVFALLLPASISHFGRKRKNVEHIEWLRWSAIGRKKLLGSCRVLSRTGSNCNFSHVQVARKISTLIYTFFPYFVLSTCTRQLPQPFWDSSHAPP